jgi:hypothetical protein
MPDGHWHRMIIPEAVFIQLSSWGWAHSCSKHVEESNKCSIEEIVHQVGYLPELYENIIGRTCSQNQVLSCFQKRPVLPTGQSETPAAAFWAFTCCRLKPDAKTVYHKYLLTCGITCNSQPETQVSYIWRERAVLLHCREIETLSKRQPEVLCDNGPSRSIFNKTAFLSRSSVSLFQHTCGYDKTIDACFLHISGPRTIQRCIWKVPTKGNLSFYISQQQKAKRNSHKTCWNFFYSFVSTDGTLLLAIFQDTCKSLCHDMFSGIFVTALFVVYSLYCLGLLTFCKK